MQFSCFWTNGQICSAMPRLCLHFDVAPQCLSRLKMRAEAMRIGDAMQFGCGLGRLVCEGQHQNVQGCF